MSLSPKSDKAVLRCTSFQIILPSFSRNPKEHICMKLIQLFPVVRDTKVWLVSLDRMGSLARR